MTLFRQIALLISAIFLALLVTIAWNEFQQSSRYLQGQQQTTAQDMATTLGITLANTAYSDDPAAIETLFNAVFDSGYYSRIELVSPQGSVIETKEQEIVIRDVPRWFVNLVQLQGSTGSTQVMKGWVPFGTLSITMHPGYVYAQLYSNLEGMLIWFLALAAGGLTALWWLLHLLMRPLQAVQKQAEAIQENAFIRQEKLPKTRELRHVVDAMNRMVGKVQTIFNDQSETLRRYHELLYRDPLTGLGNRRYFLMRLGELSQDESTYGGTLTMIHLNNLEALNLKHGYVQGNEVMVKLSRLLEASLPPKSTALCARMNNLDFIVYSPESMDDAYGRVAQLFDAFRENLTPEETDTDLWLCAGLTPLEAEAPLSDVLSDVDFSLTHAKAQGAYRIYRHEAHQTSLPQGKTKWRSWLEESLAAGRFFLVGQSVHNADDSVFHRELYVRLKDQQEGVIPAGQFMPIASSLGLEFAIDKEVFRMALDIQSREGAAPVAINLSSTFLSKADALAEFEGFVRRYATETRAPLHIEITHAALTHYTEVARHIADMLRNAGYSIGIDHFDPGSEMQSLQQVRPHYIKVDARRLAELAKDSSAAGLQALKTLAGSLDISIVAVGVDSRELHESMRELGITAIQGNHLDEPRELA